MYSQIIARLQAAGTTFRQVAGAAEFPSAEEEIRQLDAAFVMPLRDKAGPNQLGAGATHQQVTEAFGVTIAASRSGKLSGAAVDVLDPHRTWVKDQLIGWAPDGCDPIEYSGGQLMAISGRVIWWQLEFFTTYDERHV